MTKIIIKRQTLSLIDRGSLTSADTRHIIRNISKYADRQFIRTAIPICLILSIIIVYVIMRLVP